MQQCSKIFFEASKNYKPNLVRCNPSVISSLEWLNPNSDIFQNNQKQSILPQDIVDYLSELPPEESFKFLIGFHGINFQFWSSESNVGFTPYFHRGESGIMAALYGFKSFFESMKKESRLDIFSQADLFQHFQNIPNLSQRYKNLKSIWQPFVLEQAFPIVKSACDNAFMSSKTIQQLRNLIHHEDESFQDRFFRKEILFIWDIQNIYQIHHKKSINLQVPMVSDHQTAKVFNSYNLLTYNDEVTDIIQKGIHIEINSEIELAIRSASILISSQICQRQKITTYELYKSLWATRKEKKNHFHLTPTIFY